jgi:hypothetical protein
MEQHRISAMMLVPKARFMLLVFFIFASKYVYRASSSGQLRPPLPVCRVPPHGKKTVKVSR